MNAIQAVLTVLAVKKYKAQEEDVLIYRTQDDSKVDPLCEVFMNEEWDQQDPFRPVIPIHPNCRCFWQRKSDGRNLGQF